jgi:arylsulfatase A-like enzyme
LLKSSFRTAVAYAALYLLCWFSSGLSYLGKGSEAASSLVRERYLVDYLLCNLRLLGLTLMIGALLGLYAMLVVRGMRCPSRRQGIAGLVMAMLLTLTVLSSSFLHAPQLFIEPFLGGGVATLLLDSLYNYGNPRFFNGVLLLSLVPALIGLWSQLGSKGAILLLLFLAGVGWWGLRPIVPAAGKGDNVILLMVDSLRSDRVSGLGYERQTTPEIDKRLADAAIFPETYVPLPRTLPSLVSFLTGAWPQQHGIRTMFPAREALADIPPALPQRLRENGFATVVVADYAGEMFHDLSVGFERVSAPEFNFRAIYRQRSLETQLLLLAWLNNRFGRLLLPELALLPNNSDPEALVDRVLATVDDLPEPFFLMVFMSAPHFPYTARYPDDRLFTDPDYRGPYRFATPFFLPDGYERTTADIAQVNALYDGALHGADRAIGRLLDNLESQGYLHNSLIALTGDHGENLYEPDAGLGHGDHFYGGLQSVRVPLFIWGTGDRLPQGRYDEAVSSIDLAPTLLDLLKLPPLSQAAGVSLLNRDVARPVYSESGLWMDPVNSEKFAKERIAYPGILETAEIDFSGGDEIVLRKQYRHRVITARHRLLLDDDWALLYLPTRNGVRYELFHLVSDPGMTRDLTAAEPARLAGMREQMLDWLRMEPKAHVRRDYVVFPD